MRCLIGPLLFLISTCLQIILTVFTKAVDVEDLFLINDTQIHAVQDWFSANR